MRIQVKDFMSAIVVTAAAENCIRTPLSTIPTYLTDVIVNKKQPTVLY